MNPRNTASVVLLLFVTASLGYLVYTETSSSQDASVGRSEDAASEIVADVPVEPNLVALNGEPADAPSATAHRSDESSPPRRIIAYYFHNRQRCKTCLTIERLAEEALREHFPGEFEHGQLEWQSLNVEQSPNFHFVDEYELVTSSLVLVEVRDGKPGAWEKLDRVWQLVHDDESAYKQYIIDHARRMLEPGA